MLVLGGVGGGEIVSWDEMEDVDENDTAPQHTHPRTQEPRAHNEHEIILQATSAVGVGRGGGLSPFFQTTPGTNVKRDRRGRLTSARRHTHPLVVSSSSSDEALDKPSLKRVKQESAHEDEILHTEEKSSETPQTDPALKETTGGANDITSVEPTKVVAHTNSTDTHPPEQSGDSTPSSRQKTPVGSSRSRPKKSAMERAERLEAPRNTAKPRARAAWVRAEDRNAKSRKADKKKHSLKGAKRSEFLPDVVYLNDVQHVKKYTPHSEFLKELNRVLPEVDVQGKVIQVNGGIILYDFASKRDLRRVLEFNWERGVGERGAPFGGGVRIRHVAQPSGKYRVCLFSEKGETHESVTEMLSRGGYSEFTISPTRRPHGREIAWAIAFDDKGQCDKIIKEGVMLRQLEYALPWTPFTRAKKCHWCQERTSHVAQFCENHARCGFCGLHHSSRSCTSIEPSCANCHQPHAASSPNCPVFLKKVLREADRLGLPMPPMWRGVELANKDAAGSRTQLPYNVVTASAHDRATVTTLKILVGAMATLAGKHASPSTEALQQSTKELGRKTEGELINVVATGLETLLQIIK